MAALNTVSFLLLIFRELNIIRAVKDCGAFLLIVRRLEFSVKMIKVWNHSNILHYILSNNQNPYHASTRILYSVAVLTSFGHLFFRLLGYF